MPEKITPENIRVGGLLQAARKSKGITQDELAKKIGMAKNHISAIERGAHKASIDTLLGYCKILEYTPNEILGYGKERSIQPDLRMLLLDMSEEQQEKLLQILQIVGK